jgi:hypothetical protein
MFFCNKCGTPVNNNMKFCPNCGQINQVIYQQPMTQHPINSNNNDSMSKQIIVAVSVACSVIIIAVAALLISGENGQAVYFSDDDNVTTNEVISSEEKKVATGQTSVAHDNTYVLNANTTVSLVSSKTVEDSTSQKSKCPKDVVDIENRIVQNYKIQSVNLCELDKNFALELEQVVKFVYNEYPTARGYLNQLSLGNLGVSNSAVAFFQWSAPFTSSTVDSYMGYRSRIILNTTYYLNEPYFEAVMVSGTKSGHNPANSNKYSILAHEFGHYLSFIAANKYNGAEPTNVFLNNYNSPEWKAIVDFAYGTSSLRMIEEAYNNYKSKTNTKKTIDEFRATISDYAVYKDNNGKYIYDETIAEAFQDVYVNGDKAVDASKEVVAVLKKYLEM